MNKRQVIITLAKRSIYIYLSQERIRLISTKNRPIPCDLSMRQINAAAYYSYLQRSKRDKSICVFSASLKDIEKALASKRKVDVISLLPKAHRHMA
jgi:hypothetical protein